MRPESMIERAEERGAVMKTRWAMVLLLALALVLSMAGCGEEEVVNAPKAADFAKEREALATRKVKPRAKPAGGEAVTAAPDKKRADTEYAAGERDYFYDPRGKRDPFRSFRFVDEEQAEKKEFGPLGDFELGQLELSAVIWDATNPRALILDPGGRSYIVREGSQIGKNNGQVIHIGDNLVLVKETYENFAGEKTTKDVELRISLSQGG
jgi:type IV pilus assembly protein PilP